MIHSPFFCCKCCLRVEKDAGLLLCAPGFVCQLSGDSSNRQVAQSAEKGGQPGQVVERASCSPALSSALTGGLCVPG
jgi:hypothetical protein